MTVDADYDEEIIEDEPVRRRSPLRLILIILLILVGLCVICYFLSQVLGPNLLSRLPINVPGLPVADTPTPALPVTDTATPLVPTEEVQITPTEEGLVTPTEEGQVAPTEEAQVIPTTETGSPVPATEEATAELATTPELGELPATTEPTPTATPTIEEMTPTSEPTDELVDEHEEEPVDLTPTATATTAPVPGPTATPQPGATPGPTETVAAADCDNNTPPIAQANGPYTAMMGKGQAFVIFEATGSTDPDGTITRYEWDFGDNSATETGQSVTHGYSSTGSYEATLTVTDNCDETSEATVEVTITGPTPPANGSTGTPTPANGNPVTPVPTATSQASQIDGTMGFCHLVAPGDTLFGIAQRYGVAVPDLALVNGVNPDYFVITGQGLFIPTGQIKAGPNVYQVQAGDTLDSIAFQCGLNPAILAEANGRNQDQDLSPGELITIPLWRY